MKSRAPRPALQNVGGMSLGICDKTNLINRPNVARRDLKRHEPAHLRDPNTSLLNVDVLPTLRFDVGVGDVLRLESALPRDVAFRHASSPEAGPSEKLPETSRRPAT